MDVIQELLATTAAVEKLGARAISIEAGSGGKVTIVVSVEGEDAQRLERIATERGQGIDQVVAELVRNA
jgi:hypothetical protein